jgi:hypothetical protein
MACSEDDGRSGSRRVEVALLPMGKHDLRWNPTRNSSLYDFKIIVSALLHHGDENGKIA